MVEQQPPTGKMLHEKAAAFREKGDTVGSLVLNVQALIAYDDVNDSPHFAEVLADGAIVKRNHANLHDSRRFLILAKHDMMASVEIARESGERTALALPLFELAKVQESLGQLPDAVMTYRDAVDDIVNNPPEEHDRPAVVANFKIHLATCEYKAGDKTALARAETALGELEAAENPNTYEKLVWVSGGYMRLADVLREDDPAKARASLQKAKDIIDENINEFRDLALRREQWGKLADTFDQ